MTEEFVSDNVAGEVTDSVKAGKGPEPLPPALAKLDLIAGLCGSERETTIFLTSTEWRDMAEELRTVLTKQGRLDMIPRPSNFRRLRLRHTTFVNSGSEDQDAVNILNVPEARACGFAWKRDHYMAGRK